MREPSYNMRIQVCDGIALEVLSELGLTPAQAASLAGIEIDVIRRICIPSNMPTSYGYVRDFLIYTGCSLARLTGDCGPEEDEFYLYEMEEMQ